MNTKNNLIPDRSQQNFGEMSTEDGHRVYFSGEEGKHEYGVGFLVHKDIVGAVLGCQPVSSRLISIRLRAAPFNITIIQVYAPTSGHDFHIINEISRAFYHFNSSFTSMANNGGKNV